MGLLIKNIKGLVQTEDKPKLRLCGKDMSVINNISDAYLLIENGLISDFGTMDTLKSKPEIELKGSKEIDASGRYVFPSFCDSHTHIVYAGSREIEFTGKIRGHSYEEIAKGEEEYSTRQKSSMILLKMNYSTSQQKGSLRLSEWEQALLRSKADMD
jgi:imidazolonepropionase